MLTSVSSMSFSEAVALRDRGGDPSEATAALEKLADGKGGDWAPATYELALLEHGRGRHAIGDRHLRRLGFRYRLQDEVFHPIGRSMAESVAEGEDPLRVVDAALSDPLFSAVKVRSIALNKALNKRRLVRIFLIWENPTLDDNPLANIEK